MFPYHPLGSSFYLALEVLAFHQFWDLFIVILTLLGSGRLFNL